MPGDGTLGQGDTGRVQRRRRTGATKWLPQWLGCEPRLIVVSLAFTPQVISGSDDYTVRVWDVASGTQVPFFFFFTLVTGPRRSVSLKLSDTEVYEPQIQVRQLAGSKFALVEGFPGEHRRHRHVLTADINTLRIYKVAREQQHVGSAAPVAYFKAPMRIVSMRCHGGAVCVGCVAGAVCILSAPFLSCRSLLSECRGLEAATGVPHLQENAHP